MSSKFFVNFRIFCKGTGNEYVFVQNNQFEKADFEEWCDKCESVKNP